MSVRADVVYEFGPFRINPINRLLQRGGEVVPLKPKVFDTLLALVETRGELIAKDQLIRTVWPDSVVEENNLTQNISALRKVLGEQADDHRFIVTVPGYGYRFVAPVTELPYQPGDLVVTRQTLIRSVIEDELVITAEEQKKLPAARPKRLFAAFGGVLVFALLGWTLWQTIGHQTTRIDSIAVLPFENDTHNPELEYITEGLTDTIINALSQIGSLRVIPRSSTAHFKGNSDPLQVGRQLNVRVILTGHIANAGGGLLAIQTELTDTEKRSQLWGRRFQTAATDVLTVEEQIASQVTERLVGRITPAAEERQARSSTVNRQAFDLYLKARYSRDRRTPASLREAVGLYQAAIVRDPNYAAAYLGLFFTNMLAAEYAGVPLNDVRPAAEAALNKALQLDPSSAEAHVGLATVNMRDWNWPQAKRELDRALQLNPNSALAYRIRGNWLNFHGQYEEAVPVFQHALELDPMSSIIHTNLAFTAHALGDVQEAKNAAANVVRFDPEFSLGHQMLGEAYAREGKRAEAIAELQKAVDLSPQSPTALARLGFTYGLLGDRAKALDVARELEEKHKLRQAPGMFLAVVYAGLHDNDRVFHWLNPDDPDEKAVVFQAPGWWELQTVHSDARWQAFLRKVRLTP